MQHNAIRFAGTGYVLNELNERRSINQSIDQSVGSDQSINRINRIGTVQLLLNGLVMATETNQTKQIHTLTLTLSHTLTHTPPKRCCTAAAGGWLCRLTPNDTYVTTTMIQRPGPGTMGAPGRAGRVCVDRSVGRSVSLWKPKWKRMKKQK